MSQLPSERTRAARRAAEQIDRCPVCSASGVTGSHVDSCEERERWWLQAARAIDAAHIPGATGHDLWAHLNSRTHNEAISTHVVEVLIDLGWRPVVGSTPARLWAPAPQVRAEPISYPRGTGEVLARKRTGVRSDVCPWHPDSPESHDRNRPGRSTR